MRVEVGGHVRFLHKFLCQKRRPGTFRIICMQCNRTHNPKISTFAVLTCFLLIVKIGLFNHISQIWINTKTGNGISIIRRLHP